MDLNRNSGDADRGIEVYAIADGVIVGINQEYGSVTVEHKLSDGTKWRSETMHMRIEPDGAGGFAIYDRGADILKTIKSGEDVKRGDLIGTIGGTGPSTEYVDSNGNGKQDAGELFLPDFEYFDDHLHQKNSILRNGEWVSIDGRKVIERLAFQIFAFDSGLDQLPYTESNNKGIEVVWNDDDDVKGFVPKDGTKIIYDRSELVTRSGEDVPSFWIAWHVDPAQRERIAWDFREDFWPWYKCDASKSDGWARNEDNKRLLWDGTQFTAKS